jgi:predicted ferric reductase
LIVITQENGVLTNPGTNTNITNLEKTKIMGNLLYIIAVILVIAWLVGFIGYSAGGIIHVLLVIAIIAILFRVLSGRRI